MIYSHVLLLAGVLALALGPAVGEDAPKAPSTPRREVAPPPRLVAPKTMAELVVGTWKFNSKMSKLHRLEPTDVTFVFSEDGSLTLQIPSANIGPKMHSGTYRVRDNVLELNYNQNNFIIEKQIIVIESIDNNLLILIKDSNKLFFNKSNQ